MFHETFLKEKVGINCSDVSLTEKIYLISSSHSPGIFILFQMHCSASDTQFPDCCLLKGMMLLSICNLYLLPSHMQYVSYMLGFYIFFFEVLKIIAEGLFCSLINT